MGNMKVQERRGALYYFLGLVLLLFTLLASGVESKWEDQESLLAYLIDSGMINQELAEFLLVNCMLELSNIQNTSQNLEVNILIPQVNQILVDCVREKNQEKDSDTWYTSIFGFLFSRHLSPTRRVLAETPGQAPAPSPMPIATVSSPSPAPSTIIPVSPPEIPPRSPLHPFFPRDSHDSNLQPTGSKHTSTSVSVVNSGDKKTNKRTVVIAVVVTACVTFVAVALLFVCWRRCCGPGSGRGRNDERPLLSLSMSDYSISSSHSQKPFGLEAAVNEQKPGNSNTNHHSFKDKTNHAKTSGKFFVESHFLDYSKTEVPVETTTANSAENSFGPRGPPPLKPPPGRTQPPKPPPSNVAPPVPPPPPPPPCGPSALPGGSPPRPPPMPNSAMAGPRPPPPPTGAPRPPPPLGPKPPRSIHSGPRTSASTEEEAGPSNKTKLKPFFWDKVLANPDHSMVWHQIKSGSFQFSEEMIESLFGAPGGKNKDDTKKESSSQDVPPQYIQIIDAKKSQNLAILLKALNVTTEELCDALEGGNELSPELIQTLLKMAPTAEEELKLRLYSGELSQLGPAERFLKVLVDIPAAFKRLESLLFMCTLQEEISTLKESFEVLEAACTELRKSRLFLKLLEAVLKTGNRMNDGTFRGGAQAFKLDTLLKLSDVKGTDGKTTLLHFVVQEIIRSEGIRAARAAKETNRIKSDDPLGESNQDSDKHLRNLGLEVVSGLGNELGNVKKAAAIEADNLTGIVSKLGHAIVKAKDFLDSGMKNVPEENGFRQTLTSFVKNAEVDIRWSCEEEKRIMALVKSTSDYFHGKSGKDEGLRLFIIVRDFLIILDKVCREVKNVPPKFRESKKEDAVMAPSDPRRTGPTDPRQQLFPAIAERRMDRSSSDDES